MPSFTLDFLNKNMYRKYPLRGTSTHLFTNGRELPQALFSSIQISATTELHKCYISKVYVRDNYISVLLREADADVILGNFSGKITSNHQSLRLDPVLKELSGSITIGDKEALKLVYGANYLTSDTGRIEDSAVFVYRPPAVQTITNKTDSVRGFATFTGENILITPSVGEFNLSVIDKNRVLSKNDYSGAYGNCTTPTIKKINSVLPNVSGNIDIYGVDPITISIVDGKIQFITPDLTLPDVCPEKNKLAPPSNASDSYYTPIEGAADPEWKTWPQFSSE